MNVFNLAAVSLRKKIIITILIIMELTVLFFAENYAVCSLKERTMLSAPYNKILGDDSVFVYDANFPLKASKSDTSISPLESRSDILKGLNENYKIYDFLYYHDLTQTNCTVYSVADELYSSLAIPLTSGKYGNAPNSAVASSGLGKGNVTIDTLSGTINLDICGTLTSNTYVPENTSYNSDLTIEDLYTVNNSGNVIITARSGLGEAEKSFNASLGFILKFNSPKSAENGMNFLKDKAAVISGNVIKTNTNALIFSDISSFLPLICCILFITLIGIISISSMIFDETKYRTAVLWLCGYSRKKIVLIQAASIAILLIASLAVFALLALAVNLLISNEIINSDSFSKMSFGLGNLAITLITCAFLIIAAVAIPAVKTFKKSPVEYLGRAK